MLCNLYKMFSARPVGVALPYSKVCYERLLRPPFSAHSSPRLLIILYCHPKIPCFVSFWSKITNLLSNDPTFLIFLLKKLTILFRKYKIFHKFPSKFATNTFCLEFRHWKTPFLCKISLFTWTTLFFCDLSLTECPLLWKLGRTPASVLYSSPTLRIFCYDFFFSKKKVTTLINTTGMRKSLTMCSMWEDVKKKLSPKKGVWIVHWGQLELKTRTFRTLGESGKLYATVMLFQQSKPFHGHRLGRMCNHRV